MLWLRLRSRVLFPRLRSLPFRWLLLWMLHRSRSLFLHSRLWCGCLSFRRGLRVLLRRLPFRSRLLAFRPRRGCRMLPLLRLHRSRSLLLDPRLRSWSLPFGSRLRVLLWRLPFRSRLLALRPRRRLLLPRRGLRPHPG